MLWYVCGSEVTLRWYEHVTSMNEDDFVERMYEDSIEGEGVRKKSC